MRKPLSRVSIQPRYSVVEGAFSLNNIVMLSRNV